MKAFRAWLPEQPEPNDWPFLSPIAEMAAADLIRSDERTDIDAITKSPILVLVRDSETNAIKRCHVTAETEVRIYGYPAEIDDIPAIKST